MLVKVLPSDNTKESYFKELTGDVHKEIERIVGGPYEVVKTQTLANKFGYSSATGYSNVVMLVNETGQRLKLPINEKASQYYPNDYGLSIRGEAVLTGWHYVYNDPEDFGLDITDMPLKWKVIYDMEVALEKDQDDFDVHKELDKLLLSVTDPDVKKMYEEARDQLPFWWL